MLMLISQYTLISLLFVPNYSLTNTPKPITPPYKILPPDEQNINGNDKIVFSGGGYVCKVL